MGYILGFFKYVLKGPVTNPIAFFIYGSGLMAFLNGVLASRNGDVVVAAVTYYETKYLPPTAIEDIAIPIFVGAVVAGLKWYVNTPRNSSRGRRGRSRRGRYR